MPRTKRTAREITKDVLEEIKRMDANGEEITKTDLANAVGINNTLITSILNAMVKDGLVKKVGKKYTQTPEGKATLLIETLQPSDKVKLLVCAGVDF